MQVPRQGVEAQALTEALPGARLVDIHSTISSIRLHKQAADVAAIRKAIKLSEAALEAAEDLEDSKSAIIQLIMAASAAPPSSAQNPSRAAVIEAEQ